MKYTLGFIGCGNMGGALVTAAAKAVQAKHIAVCDYDKAKVEKFENELSVVGVTASELAKNAKFVVLGVKPQVMSAASANGRNGYYYGGRAFHRGDPLVYRRRLAHYPHHAEHPRFAWKRYDLIRNLRRRRKNGTGFLILLCASRCF